jgi:tetratricopeptide (TPR) repeat protein
MKNLGLLLFLFCFGCISHPKESTKPAAISSEQRDLFDEYFYQAEAARQRNQVADAYKWYEKASALQPSSGNAWYQMARISLENNQLQRAWEQSQKAVQAEPSNYWFLHLYAQLSTQGQKVAVVKEAYEKLIQLKPQEATNYLEMANYFAQNGQPKSSVEYLDRLEKIIGPDLDITELKMELYQSMRKPEMALKEALKYQQTAPEDLSASMMLVKAYLQNNQRENAEKILVAQDQTCYQVQLFWADLYRKDQRIEDQWIAVEKAFRDDRMEVTEKVGILAQEMMFRTSESDRARLLKLAAEVVVKNPESGAAHALLADLYSQKEEWKKASFHLQKALENLKEGQKMLLWQQYLNCDIQLQSYDSLVKHAQQAISQYPNQALFYFYQGVGHLQFKQHAEAVSALKNALGLTTDEKELRAEIYQNLGEAYQGLKKFAASEEAFETALSIVPDNIGLMNNYAYYLTLRKEKLDRAEEMAKKVVEKEPNQPSYLDTYAWVLFCKGKFAEALPLQLKAVQLGGEGNATLVEHLGDIYSQLGQKEKALEQWRKAKSLGADRPEVLDRKLSAQTYME